MKNLMVIIAVGCFISVSAQQNGKINLVGNAEKQVMPDQAVFNIEIKATKKSESESFSTLQNSVKDVLDRLKSVGYEENQIKLVDYSVEIETDWSGGKMKQTGYSATQSFYIKIPIDKEKILATYSALAKDKIEGLNVAFSTQCSDTLSKRIQNELIVLALKDAREKADLIALSSNCKIVSLTDINYNTYDGLPYKVKSSVRFNPPLIDREVERLESHVSSDFYFDEQGFHEGIMVSYAIQNNR